MTYLLLLLVVLSMKAWRALVMHCQSYAELQTSFWLQGSSVCRDTRAEAAEA